MSSETYKQAESGALSELLWTGDGPVTPFVVIDRGIELARQDKFKPINGVDDPLANALSIALETLNGETLASSEMPRGGQ